MRTHKKDDSTPAWMLPLPDSEVKKMVRDTQVRMFPKPKER